MIVVTKVLPKERSGSLSLFRLGFYALPVSDGSKLDECRQIWAAYLGQYAPMLAPAQYPA